MYTSLSRLVLLGMALALLAACGTLQQGAPPAASGTAATPAAALAAAGEYTRAAAAYQALAAQDRRQRDHYLLAAARAWQQAGQLEQTATLLPQIRRDRLTQATDRALLAMLEADLALNRGDPQPALALAPTLPGDLPQDLEAYALDLHARAQAANGDLLPAAVTRARLQALLPVQQRPANAEAAITLLAQLPNQDLQRALAQQGQADEPLPTWLLEAMRHNGLAVPLLPPPLTEPANTMASGNAAPALPQQIGVLLPLSGSLGIAGETIFDGYLAAYFQSQWQAPRPDVRAYDTRGTGVGAQAAYRQAQADGATFIVGPLLHEGVAAVLGIADPALPMLALNDPEPAGVIASDVARFALRPEAEGAQVATRMYQFGLTRAIVIVSSRDAATRAADAFTERFRELGGDAGERMTATSTDTDYLQQLKALLAAADPATGLFLAVGPDLARLIVPQVRLLDGGLPIYATSHIYNGDNDPVADADLDRIEFTDAPWLFETPPGFPARSALAASMPAARGARARLFAFGMDAWMLTPYLPTMLQHPGRYLPGATGTLVADSMGRIQRVLSWAHFEHGIASAGDGLQLNPPTAVPAD